MPPYEDKEKAKRSLNKLERWGDNNRKIIPTVHYNRSIRQIRTIMTIQISVQWDVMFGLSLKTHNNDKGYGFHKADVLVVMRKYLKLIRVLHKLPH